MRQRITLLAVLFCAISLQVVAQVSQLAGSVRWQNGGPAQDVTLTIGTYSVVTDRSGAYRFRFLQPGTYSVAVTPPGKPTKSFKVQVGARATKQDFTITW
jgi:hypothetical protein